MVLSLFNQIFDLGHRASISDIEFHLEDRIPSQTSNFDVQDRTSMFKIE